MKIEDRVSNYMALSGVDAVKPGARPKGNPDQKNVGQGDAFNVQLSTAATQGSEDEVRLERLNAIRQQLAEGTYNISGKDVAEKILKVLKG